MRAPHVRTLHIEPVGPIAQTCNILYPRDLLERLDGFDERAITGEDVGLSMRVNATGYGAGGLNKVTAFCARRISASESRKASVDSAPWFWFTRSTCNASRQPPVVAE